MMVGAFYIVIIFAKNIFSEEAQPLIFFPPEINRKNKSGYSVYNRNETEDGYSFKPGSVQAFHFEPLFELAD